MPTREADQTFFDDWARLTEEERRRFKVAVGELVADLRAGRQPRPGLRVHRLETFPGIWSLTWAPDGRATFQYGAEVHPGEPHIVWRRIGTHDVHKRP